MKFDGKRKSAKKNMGWLKILQKNLWKQIWEKGTCMEKTRKRIGGNTFWAKSSF